jgi:phosphatidylglycerol:prolipoprotein diacylglycerol transferase
MRLAQYTKTILKSDIIPASTCMLIGSIIGSRLFTIVVALLDGTLNISQCEFPMIFGRSGHSIHGGGIGVIVAIALYSRFYKKDKYEMMDLVAATCSVGIGFGRICNHINGNIFGIMWSCKYFEQFPVLLLEAFLEGFILFLIVFLPIKQNLQIPAKTSGVWLIFYGIFRIFCEFFKASQLLMLCFNQAQVLSLFVTMFGCYLYYKCPIVDK